MYSIESLARWCSRHGCRGFLGELPDDVADDLLGAIDDNPEAFRARVLKCDSEATDEIEQEEPDDR